MSYGTNVHVIDFGAVVQQIGVAGCHVASMAGHGAFALGASTVDGVLALRELAGDALQDRTAAQGSVASFLQFRTSLSSDTLPLFRSGLEARGLRFAEGGSIHLGDGADRSISFTALGDRGQVLFFVRPGDDGHIEILAQNRQALGDVEGVLSETIAALAVESLRQQGFGMKRQGAGRWVMERFGQDGLREQIVFAYRQGRLQAEAVSVDRQGHVLDGNACPDLSAFVGHFANPRFQSLSRDSGRRALGRGRGDASTHVELDNQQHKQRRH